MSARRWAGVWIGVATVVVLLPAPAQAGRVAFGKDETIHVIQATNDPEHNICYKTTTFVLVAGCYVTDDGYVLQKKGESKMYIPLSPATIQELQKDGTLPSPLPPYSLSLFDYAIGYSNWIILAFVVGIPMIKGALTRARARPVQAEPLNRPGASPAIAARPPAAGR